MKKLIVLLGILLSLQLAVNAQNEKELWKYENFLKDQHTSAKDYVFELFKRYDIVILCERDHREMTQYDLILSILQDERFSNNIKNAYFEIGNAKNNESLNQFLHTSGLNENEISANVMQLHRDCYGAGLWEKANYSYLLQGAYKVNEQLPEKKKINIRGLDIGVDWQTATVEDIKLRDQLVQSDRDSVLAANFIGYYNQQNSKKALVVLNYRHALTKDVYGRKNAGRYIADTYKKKVANVYINSFVFNQNGDEMNIMPAQEGKWDAAFFKTRKFNIGFNLYGSPFAKDNFDMLPFPNELTYGDMFTGFIYYNYFGNLKTVTGMENFVDDAFAPELMRRYKLEQHVYNNDLPEITTLKTTYNTIEEKSYQNEFPAAITTIEKWLK